ncbi:MAG: TetR/AcrR family transcriptional regulator [Acidobacteria bacterium]|nr:TetR/AcrR family transcriptional regulator [Acidobacteriota bacterium]
MKQEARSERSRTQILAAALRLFSSQGYRGTNMREIAEAAGVSTGNVYHQFEDKEAIFQSLLDEYVVIQASVDYPFNKAIADGAFPDDLEKLGHAIRESFEQTRPYALLVYVDIIEFEGRHLRQFYEGLTARFEAYLQTDQGKQAALRFREGVSPLTAMQFATRFLVKYFEVEVLFGVPDHYGRSSKDVLAEMADVMKFGLLKPAPTI